MRRLFWLLCVLSFSTCPGLAQGTAIVGAHRRVVVSGGSVTPIAIESTCTGTSGWPAAVCSSALTVTAGDTIVCSASATGYGGLYLWVSDPTNGIYDVVEGTEHPGSSNTWVTTAVMENSAAGSITPQATDPTGNAANINLKCRALGNTRTADVLDGGGVDQTNVQSTAAKNPTSGTAVAPGTDNNIVLGAMVRASTATVSDASPWVPGTTITAVGTSYPLYDHYTIQTTATAVNSPMTASSAKYVDTQLSVLNASNPAGYRGALGFFGVPAISKTNGASVTAADLSGSLTTLSNIPPSTSPAWSLTGSAATYDTSINPTGTARIAVDGIGHSFGDAATSIQFSGSQTSNYYQYGSNVSYPGTANWLSTFYRMGSSGTTSGSWCDGPHLGGGTTEHSFTIQALYDSTDGLYFFMEPYEGGRSVYLTGGWSLDTDYWLQVHIASVNERYHQLLVYAKSGGTWTLSGTLNYDVLCSFLGGTGCTAPPAVATTTGTASAGSTTLTVADGTGIVQGQVVLATGIADPSQSGLAWTTVDQVSGTTVTLSQPTLSALSGTTVEFVQAPNLLITATNGTASAGSTALTITVPSYGTIAQSDPVGGAGIAPGTFVADVSGSAVTLSQPTTAALSSTGVTFWDPPNTTEVTFGKWSSCNVGGSVWYSGMFYDPMGVWGAFAPN